MKYLKKFSNNRGSISIEASLVSIIFILGYFIINNIAMNILVESITRKTLFETAVELSTYIQILDEFDLSENIETSSFDFENYKDILYKGIDTDFERGVSTIIDDLYNQIKNDSINSLKNNSYQRIMKLIFSNKLKEIKNDINIEKLGLVGGIDGIDFSNSKILENGNEIDLTIKYKFNLDKFGLFSYKNEITQKQILNLWISKTSKLDLETIWKSSNFIRGRYFANSMISHLNAIPTKKGKGIDFYNNETNTLIQVFSLNIFDKTYSNFESDKYKLKEEFLKVVKNYYKKIHENTEKLKGIIETANGEVMSISNPNLKLILILPEEAEDLTNIKDYYNYINQNFGNTEFIFMEKNFNAN